MSQRGLVRGSPLRTLCLLLANRPDLVHEGSLAQGLVNPGATAGPGSNTTGVAGTATSLGGAGGLPTTGSNAEAFPGATSSALPGAGQPMFPVATTSAHTAAPARSSPGSLTIPGVRIPTSMGLPSGSGAYTPGSGGYRGSHSGFGFFTPGLSMGGVGPSGGDVLLSQWRENLAIVAANRTAADVEPILQLGDRLLQEQNQVLSQQ